MTLSVVPEWVILTEASVTAAVALYPLPPVGR
jgi:hypothetical protein